MAFVDPRRDTLYLVHVLETDDPEKDPDIDMFMGSWQESIPFNTHGALVERFVMTPLEGDPLKPTKRGAVLTAVNRFSRAHLDTRARTTPTTRSIKPALVAKCRLCASKYKASSRPTRTWPPMVTASALT